MTKNMMEIVNDDDDDDENNDVLMTRMMMVMTMTMNMTGNNLPGIASQFAMHFFI